MASEKRIALIAVILAAGMLAAFLLPRGDQSSISPTPEESPLVHFREPNESPQRRSTLLTPVETHQQHVAPTASTQGSLPQSATLDSEGSSASSLSAGLPTFQPQPRPELPRLTDETLLGEFMQPPARTMQLPPLDRPVVGNSLGRQGHDASDTFADGLTPVPARHGEPAAGVGRQVVQKPLKEHIVRDGDTLERLARRYLGDETRYREILELNAETLSDPEVLPLGSIINIPPRDAPPRMPASEVSVTAPPLIDSNNEATNVEAEFGGINNPLRGELPPLEPIRRAQ